MRVALVSLVGLLSLLCASSCSEVVGVDFSAATLKDGVEPASQGSCAEKTCADLGVECGLAFDACGTQRDCGACKDGSACNAGKCGCTPKSCVDLGKTCGTQTNGCGGALDCGKCANPADACVDGACKCQPKSCAEQGADCGTVPDGCGGQYICGTCSDASKPNCGGGGPNKCGATACTPKSCAQQGKDCGQISDGCGTLLQCGTCTSGTCGGGGVANKCGCTPTTCAAQGKSCGQIPDGCGGTLNCGSCALPDTCGGGGTAGVCGCTATSFCDECCGTGMNNCGKPCYRSTCCGGGGGCFGAGTPIRMANGTTKPIETVRAGDVVASYDPRSGSIVSARVISVSVHGPETSKDGFLVIGGARVTPNHPLFVDGVKRPAGSLRVAATRTVLTVRERSSGMLASYDPSVLAFSPQARPVGAIELLPGNGEPTYDLHVEGSGTFVAGGVVAAQKQIP